MKTVATEDNTGNGSSLLFASSKMTAIGLWITALGIFFQAVSGAKGYPKVPPGIIILAAIGVLVYVTARWRWSPLIGVLLAGFISIGVFTTSGTGYRLGHPADIGPLLGTLVQLTGLLIALIAGIAAIIKNYKIRN
jgi:hypothetical protein